MTNTFRQIRALCRTMRKGKWFRHQESYIRTIVRGETHCPLTFAAWVATGKSTEPAFYEEAGDLLGITRKLSDQVMEAADLDEEWALPKLRRILLKAAGLPPD
jgi:hypothetical protein